MKTQNLPVTSKLFSPAGLKLSLCTIAKVLHVTLPLLMNKTEIVAAQRPSRQRAASVIQHRPNYKVSALRILSELSISSTL